MGARILARKQAARLETGSRRARSGSMLAGLHSATRVSSFRMAKPNSHAPLGEGGRFAAFVARLVAEGKSVEQAKAIAAAAGRRKYGAKRMASMAAKGRKS